MFLVAIHGWLEATPELAESVATTLGIHPFEARQRLLAGSPAVIASFAATKAAEALVERLRQRGLSAVIVDGTTCGVGHRVAERFTFTDTELCIETSDGPWRVPYAAVELLLLGTGTVVSSELRTVSARKFSLGKTLLAGGVPMTSKVVRQESFASEDRRRCLYLYTGQGPPLVFIQPLLSYDGLGPAMQLTQELNFPRFIAELRRRSPQARYDERLLNRQTLARLLGPARPPENDLDLAVAILARTLRS